MGTSSESDRIAAQMSHTASAGPQRRAGAAPLYFERERGVTEIVSQPGITHFQVRTQSPTQRLALLQSLAGNAVPIFLVKLHPDGLSFAVRQLHAANCEKTLASQSATCDIDRNLALVSTIAGAMRDLSGVIAHIYEALLLSEIAVQQTGDAYNAVHCLVAGDHAPRAVAALRERFGLDTTEQAVETTSDT